MFREQELFECQLGLTEFFQGRSEFVAQDPWVWAKRGVDRMLESLACGVKITVEAFDVSDETDGMGVVRVVGERGF